MLARACMALRGACRAGRCVATAARPAPPARARARDAKLAMASRGRHAAERESETRRAGCAGTRGEAPGATRTLQANTSTKPLPDIPEKMVNAETRPI